MNSKITVPRNIEPDFIRGIAIILAMGWHFNGITTNSAIVAAFLAPGKALGWAGVDLFFVLSGYLIGGLIFNEYKKTGMFWGSRFLVRRALKIWPVFYAFLFIFFIAGIKPWREWLLPNLFHVQNFFGSPISHLWSLAVEEHFYLAFALLFAIFATNTQRVSRIPLVLVFIMIFTLLLRIVAVKMGVDGHSMQIMSMFRMDSLVAGVLLAHIKIFNKLQFEFLASKKLISALIFVAGVVVLCSFDAHGQFICSVGYTIAYITAAAFLLFCQNNRLITDQGIIVRSLAAIGIFSYGLYVCHVILIRVSDILVAKLPFHDNTGLISLAIRYGGSLILAIVVTRLVEYPFIKLRDKVFPPRVTVTPSEVEEIEELSGKAL